MNTWYGTVRWYRGAASRVEGGKDMLECGFAGSYELTTLVRAPSGYLVLSLRTVPKPNAIRQRTALVPLPSS